MTLRTRPVLIAAGFFAACGLASATIWNPHPPPSPPVVVTPPPPLPAPTPTRAIPTHVPGLVPSPAQADRLFPSVNSAGEPVPLPPLVARFMWVTATPKVPEPLGEPVLNQDSTGVGSMVLSDHRDVMRLCEELSYDGLDAPLAGDPAAFIQALNKAYPDFTFTWEDAGQAPVEAGRWEFHDRYLAADGAEISFDQQAQIETDTVERLPTGEIGVFVQTRESMGLERANPPRWRMSMSGGQSFDPNHRSFVGRTYFRTPNVFAINEANHYGRFHLFAFCMLPASRSARH